MDILQLFALFGALAVLLSIISLIALHVLPTGVNPLTEAVSNYSISDYGIFYRVQTTLSGLAALFLVALLASTGVPAPFIGNAALIIYALARIFVPSFEVDIPPLRSRGGRVHRILTATSFAAIAIAAVTLTPALTAVPPWSNVATALLVATALTVIAALAYLIVAFVPALRRVSGLVERFIYLGALLWLALVFGVLITR